MNVWCLTTSPGNVEKTAQRGWKVQGIKARRGKTARDIHPGDRLVYYVTGVSAFAGIVEVRSEVFEDHEPIWTSKPGEDYPWRFDVVPDVVLDDPGDWVPADELQGQLEFPRKWPAENWKLAFQGNIRQWPDGDYRIVKAALTEAAGHKR